ncbi:hypothetical protein CMQ_1608 [Grosmannia clavigera kw1407]|uniref:Uncharacterized protein n=1 Tax=Grosmannia clavigera (strain kw1407 / UAMH 11150) TaxID=655863 RepID=F0XE73_GROCL|nr:uncharacterized protein CMQ_1608 [Grosmannia clavigera kw1407]EFX04680.1 hypothetical protein CMQ_1608 [Grosmannia clavigera kw1407]
MIAKEVSTIDKDHFRLDTHHEHSRDLFQAAGLMETALVKEYASNEGHDNIPIEWDEPLSDHLPGFGRHYKQHTEKLEDTFWRFFWAFGCGISLVGPMLIMVLIDSKLAKLLTASIAIILYGIVVAIISAELIPGIKLPDFGIRDVVAVTLAYAAVMVVFVGVS